MIKSARGMICAVFCLLPACGGQEAASAGSYQGSVEYEETTLAFEVPGRVASVTVQRGDLLEAGRPVAVLDDKVGTITAQGSAYSLKAAEAGLRTAKAGPRTEEVRALEAQLRAAEVQVEQLGRDVSRARALTSSGTQAPVVEEQLNSRLDQATAQREAISNRVVELKRGTRPSEVERVSAQVDMASAQLALERARLEKHQLHAALAGVVLDVLVKPGEVVAPGTPVLTIADTAHPYADVFVAQQAIAGLRVGQSAALRVDGEAQAFEARIDHIGRQLEFTPRFLFSERERPNLVLRVRVSVQDPQTRLHAGIPAFVTFANAKP